MSPLPQQWPLPQERYLFSHYRSSGRSRRSSLPFFLLPQQCLPPQELSLRFPTALAVPAPAGALPVFPHYRSSDCSPMSATCIFPTATAVSAPAGALPVFPHCRSSARSRRSANIFPHCRSSARSRRSLPIISPLPQQCPLPQERYLYFPTAAAVSAPAGAPSIPPHCRSSVCSHRSTIYIFPHCRSSIYPHILPPLPTPPHQHTSAEAASSSKMPQHLYKHCPASHQP